MQTRKQFDYRPKKLKTVALFLPVFAGAVVLTYFAITLDQPIQNARGIRLTQNQARIICGLFAVLSPIGLYFIGSTVYAAFSSPQQLILTDTAILIPNEIRIGFSKDINEIRFGVISSVSVHDFVTKYSKVLRIEYSDCIANIPSYMLRDKIAFDELVESVTQAVNVAGRGKPGPQVTQKF